MTQPMNNPRLQKIVVFLIAAVLLLALPLALQAQGNAWVRIVDIALLYVLLALGLNIVVGYAGLLDLLMPLFDLVDRIPAAQAGALEPGMGVEIGCSHAIKLT